MIGFSENLITLVNDVDQLFSLNEKEIANNSMLYNKESEVS